MKYVFGTLLGILFFLVLFFGLSYFDLINYKFFAPKYEDARRNVYENTQSYVEGKRQELTKYRLEYLQTKDTASREAIRSTIVQSFANFDETKLSNALQVFLESMRNP